MSWSAVIHWFLRKTYGGFDVFVAGPGVLLRIRFELSDFADLILSSDSHALICHVIKRGELWVNWSVRSASSKTICNENQNVRTSRWWKFQLN